MKTYVNIDGYWTYDFDTIHQTIVCLGEWEGEDDDGEVIYYTDGEPLHVGQSLELNVDYGKFFVRSISSVFMR